MFEELIKELQLQSQYLEYYKTVEYYIRVQEILRLLESKAGDLIVEYVDVE